MTSTSSLSGGGVRLSFEGIAGVNYALDRSFNLMPANWTPQATNPADAGGVVFTNTRGCVKTHFSTIHLLISCSFRQNSPYRKCDRYRISCQHFSHSLTPDPTTNNFSRMLRAVADPFGCQLPCGSRTISRRKRRGRAENVEFPLSQTRHPGRILPDL